MVYHYFTPSEIQINMYIPSTNTFCLAWLFTVWVFIETIVTDHVKGCWLLPAYHMYVPLRTIALHIKGD